MLLCLKHQVSKPSKYKNVKCESALVGRSFDSRAERKTGEVLALREKAKDIRDLKFQVSIPLTVNDHLVCTWKADFTYQERDPRTKRWVEIWHDEKGFRTEAYEIKRKLVYAVYGVVVRETGTSRKKGRSR